MNELNDVQRRVGVNEVNEVQRRVGINEVNEVQWRVSVNEVNEVYRGRRGRLTRFSGEAALTSLTRFNGERALMRGLHGAQEVERVDW